MPPYIQEKRLRTLLLIVYRLLLIWAFEIFLKTDNGPAYTSQRFAKFCQEHQITHTFGIPHNPTGQAIVEHTHATLKQFFFFVK